MADDVTLNAGSGGDVIAANDLTHVNGGAVSGVKAQRVLVGFAGFTDGQLYVINASAGIERQWAAGEANLRNIVESFYVPP